MRRRVELTAIGGQSAITVTSKPTATARTPFSTLPATHSGCSFFAAQAAIPVTRFRQAVSLNRAPSSPALRHAALKPH